MNLKNKSEINLSAAELLHDKCLFPVVAHCTYYSCLQLMRYIWQNKMERNPDDLKTKSEEKIGSHAKLINGIIEFLKDKKIDHREFNNKILQLKAIRVKADYKDIQIDYTASSKSIQYSKEILKILKKAI